VTRRSTRHFVGRSLDCFDDPVIPGASADISVKLVQNLIERRVWISFDQLLRSHDHPWRAESSLQTEKRTKCLLNRVQASRGTQPLDGDNVCVVDLHGEDRA
jgi:hypothetical protein